MAETLELVQCPLGAGVKEIGISGPKVAEPPSCSRTSKTHGGARPDRWSTERSGSGIILVVAAILLVLGMFGIFLNRKNVIIILMSIELILLAVNLNLVAFSAALGDLAGQVFAMFVLTVAAAEAAIGLAIVVDLFPQSRHDPGRGREPDEGLNECSRSRSPEGARMIYAVAVFAPLVGSLVSGLLGRSIGDRAAHGGLRALHAGRRGAAARCLLPARLR